MTPMTFASVCSGIEAASAAWHPLGWRAAFLSEIEPAPCSVLAHHYPDVPNLGDMTKYKEWPDAVFDVLIGGTPCQSFSVAGLRKGLDDPRGNLALVFLGILDRYRPRWVVWENVPGVLSSESHAAPDPVPPADPVDMERDGQEMDTVDEYDSEELHAFNSFVAGLSELGYGIAYRVLDAQYFGVAQRRRRVFVIGCLGDTARAQAVLFERESLSGHPAPRREAGKGSTYTTSPSLTASGCGTERTGESRGQDCLIPEISPALKARDYKGPSSDGAGDGMPLIPEIAHTLRADGFDASEDGTGRGTPIIAYDARGNGDGHLAQTMTDDHESRVTDYTTIVMPTLVSNGDAHSGFRNEHGIVPVAFNSDQSEKARSMGEREEHTPTLRAGGEISMARGMEVRRLTPLECSRLQGFPDNYLDVLHNGKPMADGPRYKALGNSMAVPVIRWLGERIALASRLV
jgi:DNA (cytosine-5)-methyltransferase 1